MCSVFGMVSLGVDDGARLRRTLVYLGPATGSGIHGSGLGLLGIFVGNLLMSINRHRPSKRNLLQAFGERGCYKGRSCGDYYWTILGMSPRRHCLRKATRP